MHPQKEREEKEDSPEPPTRVSRLATPTAAVNLTVKTLDAIVVAEVLFKI